MYWFFSASVYWRLSNIYWRLVHDILLSLYHVYFEIPQVVRCLGCMSTCVSKTTSAACVLYSDSDLYSKKFNTFICRTLIFDHFLPWLRGSTVDKILIDDQKLQNCSSFILKPWVSKAATTETFSFAFQLALLCHWLVDTAPVASCQYLHAS